MHRGLIALTLMFLFVFRAHAGVTTSLPYSQFLPLVGTEAPTPAQEVVDRINAYRAAHTDCGPLSVNSRLAEAARLHAIDMMQHDFFGHTGSDGSTVGRRLTRQGYSWSTAAENIAGGYSTAQAAVDGWLNSPGHLANIRNCNLTETGVGALYEPADSGSQRWEYYWVQDFARPQ
jgi:uncharacterized protein YkwD